MALTLSLPWAIQIQSHFIATNLKRVGWGMRWGCASKQGIFAGGMGHMSPGFGTTKWFSKTRCCQCWLEYGERCETDGGYRGSAPEFVKYPKGVWGESGKWAMQQKVRSRQEMVNKRLKNWAIFLTNPLSSQFKAAPNSVCCSYSTSPAVLWIQPIVFSGI